MFAAVFAGTWFWFSSPSVSSGYQLFLLASAPLFVVGVTEDLGYPMGVRLRLTAAVVSGASFVAAFGQWLPRLDIPIVDLGMAMPIIAIPFTVLACAGVTHAFNLIDGLNGLSSFVSMGVSVALMAICAHVGLAAHFQALGLLLAALSGFFVVNFPFGRVFMGDGGAYVVGHILVWTSVSIVWNSPQVSAFAILLIFFWPIADTLLAIWRRTLRGSDMTRPDRLHFHQLAMRSLEISLLGRRRRHIANPLAAAMIVPMALAPMFVGVLFYDDVAVTFLCSLLAFSGFFLSYTVGMRWSKSGRGRGRGRARGGG
ncbi:UDP-phosphate N-acetylglucosaminyl 1-phosphate transferase [Rhodobacterales bacterium HKCCA1058]|nr:UDP-phosphate N-acetylglucosaminyl 1-phosphate transferase [Rhodobacterales bacterium HKCCA1058]